MAISIILNLLFLVIGMALLIKGADFFVDGASRVAKAFHIPSLIIGLTLVSIGTSLPELSVSVNAALTGNADISYGNVIGSNIFNVFVVIGASAIFTPMIIDKAMKKYDIPILLGIYGLFTIFSFVITPNVLDRIESIIFCLLFIGYLVFLVLRTKKENAGKEEEEEGKPRKMWVNIVFIILGLAGIVAGGEFVVTTAENLALMAGMSKLLVGLTIVAVGTSLPELVTSMVAAKKGENDIAVGNAVGSSIFNILLILGVASTIAPIGFETSTIIDVVAMIVSAGMIMLFAFKGSKVNRWQGLLMILVYAVYLTFIILRNFGMF
jgi:cation:H+ antiporter